MTEDSSTPIPDDEDFDTLLDEEDLSLRQGYESPLIARLRGGRLTVEMLATEIPRIRAGEEAERLLNIKSGVRSQKRVEELLQIRREGEIAKEKLFAAALPLIRTVAYKEWRRRQQWGSQITLEDLLQEATLGFLKGLSSFKPEAIRKSATNYLGQWMQVEMRRSAEMMDNDLQVGHDVGERFRKVRALRSRLINDLGREPTDEEIAAASQDSNYVTRPNMLGKAPTEKENGVIPMKGITESQIADERKARNRVGQVSRFAPVGDETVSGVDPERVTVDRESHASPVDPADLIADQAQQKVIAALVSQVVVRIQIPAEQTDVIARRFGLPPYEKEASVRMISRETGIHRERITRIINAFSAEMTRKGGYFHEAISHLSEDDLYAIGLGWLINSLGKWSPPKTPPRIPKVLLETRNADGVLVIEGRTNSTGIIAWFRCDYHDQIFSDLYPNRAKVPKARACPSCNKASPLVRTQVS